MPSEVFLSVACHIAKTFRAAKPCRMANTFRIANTLRIAKNCHPERSEPFAPRMVLRGEGPAFHGVSTESLAKGCPPPPRNWLSIKGDETCRFTHPSSHIHVEETETATQ